MIFPALSLNRLSPLTMSASKRRLRLAIVLAMGLVMAACSSVSSRRPGSSDPKAVRQSSPPAQGMRAFEQLRAKAEGERSDRVGRPTASSIEVPAGVEPGALAIKEDSDPKAKLALSTAVAEFVQAPASVDRNKVAAPVEIDQAAQSEAMKLYAKGRAAAADQKHMQAVLDFQKALELDPLSPSILRESARSYVELGNSSRAIELYKRLTALDPADEDALFNLGWAAANRRDFPAAIAALGPTRIEGRSFSHDGGADILADFTLALALRELGYDRASIEASVSSLNFSDQLDGLGSHAARLGSVYRQRGELWRSVGDAHCRLGEYEEAVLAYEQAGSLPSTDPASLRPRMVYANLCRGHRFEAQWTVLNALASRPETVNERDIQLCGYLVQHAQPTELLARSLGELAHGHPDSSGLTRAAASMLPAGDALKLLTDFVARRPRDMEAVRQLLSWLAPRDLAQAVALTVSLSDQQADRFDDYAASLIGASPSASALLEGMEGAEQSPTTSRLHARMLTKLGAAGEAWSVNAAARKAWPEDTSLILQQVELAAALPEPLLLAAAVTEAGRAVKSADGFVTIAMAHRAVGETERAAEFARRAVDLDKQFVNALLELSRSETAHAMALSVDAETKAAARTWIDQAITHAESAIALDAAREEAYEVLALIYSPGGPLADSQLFRAAAQRLRDAVPNSAVYSRLAAQEALGQRRFEQAIERLIQLCEADPTDTTSLSLLIGAWERSDRLVQAEEWLDGRLEHRPGDPALLEQWVRVKLLRDQNHLAISHLETLLAANPREYIARRLLETVYRSDGQLDAAMKLGEQRLLARPQGIRREVELAALYAGAERATQALERLQWVQRNAGDGTLNDLAAALAIAGRLPDGNAAHRELSLGLATATIDRFPQAPLPVYGTALRSLVQSGSLDERFDAVARQAATHSQGGASGALEAAANWRDLAQALTDGEHPAAGARALRAKLKSTPTMDERAHAALVRIVLILDAASEVKAVERGEATIAFGELALATLTELEGLPALGRVVETSEVPTLPTACYEVGVYFSILGANQGAATLLREAIHRQPDAAMAMNNLGYALLETQKHDEGTIELIEKAHQLAGDEPNVLDTIGWLRYKQRRFVDEADGSPGALSFIQQSIDLSDEAGAEVLDHLGDVQWRLGQEEEARQSWEKAAAMLEDSTFRERTLETFSQVQTRVWQIVVATPQQLYDRQYGVVLDRVKAKLEALARGTPPPVEPVWGE